MRLLRLGENLDILCSLFLSTLEMKDGVSSRNGAMREVEIEGRNE